MNGAHCRDPKSPRLPGVCYPQCMPAPKKSQEAKDLTRRRRDVRKHRKACRKYLGPLGMHVFREFLNLHGWRPSETAAAWAEALARVFGDDGSAMHVRGPEGRTLADYRGQFGGWSQALLQRSLNLPSTRGLCFTLRLVEVRGTSPSPWKCWILILYERQCGVMFHHLMRIGDRYPKLDGEAIWRVVDQAILQLTTGRWPVIQTDELASAPVTVAFPVDARGQWTHPVFAEAAGRPRPVGATPCSGITWTIATFRGLRSTRLHAEPYSFLDLEKMLRQEAKSVSSSLKALMPRLSSRNTKKKEGLERPRYPAWLLVFPRVYPYEYSSKD